MGLSSIWYQINQREKRNFLNPTFKKVPLRRTIKELCSFHCYKNGTRCPIKGNLSYTILTIRAHAQEVLDNRTKIKDSSQLGRKVLTHNSNGDLPLIDSNFQTIVKFVKITTVQGSAARHGL